MGEAAPFFERTFQGLLDQEDWHNASIGYQNLAELHAYLGALGQSGQAAAEALALARRTGNKRVEYYSLAWQAWAAHLRGEIEAAGVAFEQAEALEREIDSSVRYLYSLWGVLHADHLRRTGQADYARRVTEANLKKCKSDRWNADASICHRILGDLDAQEGQHGSARAHYDEALRIARTITYRPALIEALLARGRYAARHLREVEQAFADLEEALSYATQGGYRIYEADIRVALGWAHLAAGPSTGSGQAPSTGSGQAHTHARQEAQRAQQMSAQMGYHWGQLDAAELLAAIAEHPE